MWFNHSKVSNVLFLTQHCCFKRGGVLVWVGGTRELSGCACAQRHTLIVSRMRVKVSCCASACFMLLTDRWCVHETVFTQCQPPSAKHSLQFWQLCQISRNNNKCNAFNEPAGELWRKIMLFIDMTSSVVTKVDVRIANKLSTCSCDYFLLWLILNI